MDQRIEKQGTEKPDHGVMLSRTEQSLAVVFPASAEPQVRQDDEASMTGFNLSEFSLAPLSLKTRRERTRLFEWNYKAQQFFFEVSYGDPAPNAYTDDVLLVLSSLMYRSKKPLFTRASIYEILRIQGVRHKPSKQQIDQVVRHLDALCGTTIRTNFVYDREEKRWHSVRTVVLAGYTYKDERGKLRRWRVQNPDGAAVEIVREQRVFELKDFSFAPHFIRYFLRDPVPIDLGAYFALAQPTPKRIFRYGNKYVQTVGHHALDLHLFCLSRVGMSTAYVLERRVSDLASRMRAYANRVNDIGGMLVRIEQSGTASGYKISFARAAPQISLFTGEHASYSKAEREAFKCLRGGGVWPNVARSLVLRCREAYGTDGGRYIVFAARQFRKVVDDGALRAPPDKRGGVLAEAVKHDWYYPAFYEWKTRQETSQRKQEERRYEQSAPPSAGQPAAPWGGAERGGGTGEAFDLDAFARDHASLYGRLVDAVTPHYRPSPEAPVSQEHLDTMKASAIRHYAIQCLKEIRAGNTDFFPRNLTQESR